jgi:hypothetical protein
LIVSGCLSVEFFVSALARSRLPCLRGFNSRATASSWQLRAHLRPPDPDQRPHRQLPRPAHQLDGRLPLDRLQSIERRDEATGGDRDHLPAAHVRHRLLRPNTLAGSSGTSAVGPPSSPWASGRRSWYSQCWSRSSSGAAGSRLAATQDVLTSAAAQRLRVNCALQRSGERDAEQKQREGRCCQDCCAREQIESVSVRVFAH